MTTQQAPHTSPLWRRVLSLPHTRLGWWAVGLASFVLIVLVPGEFIPARALASVGWVRDALEILGLITVLVVPLVAGVVGSLALGAGERSALVWAALVPAAVFFVGLATIFQEGYILLKASIGVLFWALIAFSIFYLRSQGNTGGHEPRPLSKSQRAREAFGKQHAEGRDEGKYPQ